MFVPQTKDQIRDSLLANLQSRFQSSADGVSIDVRPGSRWYMIADAFALEQAGIQAQAQALTKQILPDKADSENLARHGAVQGVAREPAAKSVLRIRVTGTPDGAHALGTASMVATNGLTFAPNVSSAVLAAGIADVDFTCQTAGAGGNLSATTVLAWTAAPAGLNPTGTVQSITTAGSDIETEAAWAIRIIARMQEHPASFNRADVVEMCEAYAGVEQAFVYPLLEPAFDTVGTPGTMQVVVLGPIATDENGVQNGDASENTRFIGGVALAGTEQTLIEGYIEGTLDAEGHAVPAAQQNQLRPVTVPVGNYKISSPGLSQQQITCDVVVTAPNAKQWSGTMTVVSSSTTSLTVLGDHRAKNGLRVLIPIVDTVTPGGYRTGRYMTTLGSGDFSSGINTVWTLSAPLPAATVATAQVYPAMANYPQIRLALLALIDRLTPGDAAAPSSRWPSDNESGPSTLYIDEIIAALCSVPGVINATVSAPAANVVTPLKQLIDISSLIVTSN